MNELTILSPHRDDAAFSLYLSLSRWSSLGLKLNVVNFFTVSAYAPRATSQDAPTVSALRSKEDRRVLRLISRDIKVQSLDLLDAPLRLGIGVNSVCQIEAGETQLLEANRLALVIRRYYGRSLVLAPLALGNHVDHLTVNTAAVINSSVSRLGFYEDLPYATWTTEASIRERVSNMEEKTRVLLKPTIIRVQNSAPRKLRVISYYHSQITRGEAATIARFSMKYAGERIWIPKHSGHWKSLTA